MHDKVCLACDSGVNKEIKEIEKIEEERDDMSFSVLLALVPAMTMTLFSLMGLI